MSQPANVRLDETGIRTSLARFKVASIVEGIALLVLVVIMVMEYVVYSGPTLFSTTSETWHSISKAWSPIHGLIYMIYVVLAFDLWLKMRWQLGRMLLLMFFGVVPILSFFGERWTQAKVNADLKSRPTLEDEFSAERNTGE